MAILTAPQAYNFRAIPTCSVQYYIAVLIDFTVSLNFDVRLTVNMLLFSTTLHQSQRECSDGMKVKSSLFFIFATRTLWCRFLKAQILHAWTPTRRNQI
jgi:hypothetical protein